MRTKKSGAMTYLLVGAVILLSGCSGPGGYGRLAGQPMDKPRMTIDGLLANWQRYHVYYAGNLDTFPSAVLFDPKEDGKSLAADKWTRVRDIKTLSGLIFWMRNHGQRHSFVWEIRGPDGSFFGYFYSPWNHATIKAIDEHTLYVYDIPYPPELMDRGPSLLRR